MVHYDSRAQLPEESEERESPVNASRASRQTRSCKVCRARKVKVRSDPLFILLALAWRSHRRREILF